MTTPLYPTFRKRIDDAVEQLLQNKVTPWAFLSSGKPFRVKKSDGREIAYEGVAFEGSPREVFWARYIEPFLEDLTVKEVEAAVASARERGVDAKLLLPEIQSLLRAASRRVFSRMAEIDRRLMGNGYPMDVPLRRVEHKVQSMAQFIDELIRVELAMWKPKRRADGQRRTSRAATKDKGVQINIVNMENNYSAGQAGAMGPQAHAHDISFHQVSAQMLGNIDMQALAVELATLRREMRQTAVEPEQDIAIGQIAAAEAAAKKGDTSSVVSKLKKAGGWALEVATKIGVNIASDVIRKSLGS